MFSLEWRLQNVETDAGARSARIARRLSGDPDVHAGLNARLSSAGRCDIARGGVKRIGNATLTSGARPDVLQGRRVSARSAGA
eukprot:11169871-Alexandrium_andersonii.AAC.1